MSVLLRVAVEIPDLAAGGTPTLAEAVTVFGVADGCEHMEECTRVCATRPHSLRWRGGECSLSHRLIFGYVDLSVCESFGLFLSVNVYWKDWGMLNDSHREYL